jgi:hypothetical protein
MEPVCPRCGNNAFKVFRDTDGETMGKCVKCGATTSLEVSDRPASESSKDLPQPAKLH